MTEHVVQQGETLALIARKHKIADWKEIYHHPDNAGLRKQRPNPNILNPGDKIFIPQPKTKTMNVQTGKGHRFVVSSSGNKLKLKLLSADRKPLKDALVEVSLSAGKRKIPTGSQGLVEFDLTRDDPIEIDLDVFEAGQNTPSYCYTVQLNQLDTVDSVTGLQARLNALGFPAGPVDGEMGDKTKSAVKRFQKSQGSLTVDGIPGPKTHAALEKEYGC